MSRARLVAMGAAVLAGACSKPPPAAPARMEIRRVTGNIVEFIPAPDQLRYCLIYTTSAKGVTRQLTMTVGNTSVPCPPGEPVLGLRYRIPADEGRVQVQVLFSDQRLDAAQVALQVVDMAKPNFNPTDLRVPGHVIHQSLDFIPSEEPSPTVGEVVVQSKGDAGLPTR